MAGTVLFFLTIRNFIREILLDFLGFTDLFLHLTAVFINWNRVFNEP